MLMRTRDLTFAEESTEARQAAAGRPVPLNTAPQTPGSYRCFKNGSGPFASAVWAEDKHLTT